MKSLQGHPVSPVTLEREERSDLQDHRELTGSPASLAAAVKWDLQAPPDHWEVQDLVAK